MTSLVLVEHDNVEIKGATLNTVAAAHALGGDIHLLVAGSGSGAVAEAATRIAGVSKVLHADSVEYENSIAENLAPLMVGLAGDYSHIFAPADTFGKNVMPRVAAALDVQQISDISSVIDENTFERPIYAGNAIATVESSDEKKVVSVRATAFDAVQAEGGSAEVVMVDGTGEPGLTSYVGSELSQSERPELTAASIIISGGRGMQNGDNFVMLEKVADKLGAAVGASRAAVDAGFVANDYQVGQTGKIVAPEL